METQRSIALPGYVVTITNPNETGLRPSFPQALAKDMGLVRILRMIKEAEMLASGQLIMPPLDTLRSIVTQFNEGSAPDIDSSLSMRNRKLTAIIRDMEQEPNPWSIINN